MMNLRLAAIASHLDRARDNSSCRNGARAVRGNAAADEEEEARRVISWAEIQRHQMKDDAWVVIDGVVYDITEFIKDESGHPGGSEIPLEYAGKDATEFWTGECRNALAVCVSNGSSKRKRMMHLA
jgi:cytochrome b involved in lipid metabolism